MHPAAFLCAILQVSASIARPGRALNRRGTRRFQRRYARASHRSTDLTPRDINAARFAITLAAID